MIQRILTLVTLCAAVGLSGCSQSTETTAAAAPRAAAQAAPTDAATPAAAGTDAANAATAVGPAAPELPQPAIVIPPKPKAGAPHGPGFDMPLLELGGYAPPRPMDILKDAHVFAADHPEVA